MATAAKVETANRALEEVFLRVLPCMVSRARECTAPARGFMAFGLLMYIANLRAAGITVTRAELARRLNKSQQMFSSHVDHLVELGLLSMTRVPGGHGTGTQWHLDLVDSCLVDALRPLLRKLDGAAAEVAEGRAVSKPGAKAAGGVGAVSGRAARPHCHRGTRLAPRSRA